MQVVLYARVSTTRQAENELSIPDQLRQLREWCERAGHLVIRDYIEPGASATDDKRPVFQEMIAAATVKPPAFEAIVVHSLSRFFRDSVEFGVYERRLKRHGVKVVSISQQTSDDAAGEMARRLFSLFDEYQSKENAKHTSRAMRENARQGYYNGSQAPFGYRAVSTDVTGSRGRKKKRLEIDPGEAAVVRRIYDLYLNGHDGRRLGIKEIVKHLTERGLLMRGNPWRIQKVHSILADRAYLGEHYFNVRDSRTGAKRPPSEWIQVKSEPIIDAESFARVAALREARSPLQTPPRVVGSPNLLTGLVRCHCGARMTSVTGKSGRYRYYKCSNRQNKGNHACSSANLPMDKLDQLVLEHLARVAFAPERLNAIMAELRKEAREAKDSEQQKVNALSRQLKDIERRQERLLEAIEAGAIDLDLVQPRAQKLKGEREAVLIELAGARRNHAVPVERVLPSDVEAFAKAIRTLLMREDKAFAKQYLQALVDEIVVDHDTATIRGSNAKLAMAIRKTKEGNLDQVPSFVCNWRARQDSNPRPPGS